MYQDRYVRDLFNLKLRLSQIVYTLSAPCTHTHTLTPTQAFATHYAHTYVFHIFRHLPHSTLSYSPRYLHVRTHTHFQQPITGRQRILNADTEYIARTSKLTTQYISTTRTRSHLYRQLLRTIRTHTHTCVFTSLGRNIHICVPAHTHTRAYTPLITGRQIAFQRRHNRRSQCRSRRAGQSARTGRA